MKCLRAGIFLLFMVFASPLAAESVLKQVDTLEKAVLLAALRLDSETLITELSEKDFLSQAGRQVEFALINLEAGNLLEEDYYHLALYMIARNSAKLDQALELLQYELKFAELKAVKAWLTEKIREILLLKKAIAENRPIWDRFDISKEFSGFKKALLKSGAR